MGGPEDMSIGPLDLLAAWKRMLQRERRRAETLFLWYNLYKNMRDILFSLRIKSAHLHLLVLRGHVPGRLVYHVLDEDEDA